MRRKKPAASAADDGPLANLGAINLDDDADEVSAAEVSSVLAELGLEDRTIGVLTMCDDVGKRGLGLLPGRLEQTSQDAVPLQPHGYVATMTEPVEDASLTNLQRLQRQRLSGVKTAYKARINSCSVCTVL